MTELLIVVHILVAIGLVVLILLQQGKGADMGAAFGGGGGSQTLFGSRGSATFLSRTTAILAVIFFSTSLLLTVVYSRQATVRSVTDQPVPVEKQEVPAAPEVPPATVPDGVPEVPK